MHYGISDASWWWWYRRRSRSWCITAHTRQKSATRSLWSLLILPIPYILLSSPVSLLSNSCDRYMAGNFPPSSYLFCLLPIILRSCVYCLPSPLFCQMSALLWLYQLCSHAHHHHKAAAAAMATFNLPIFNSTADMTSWP